MRMVSLCYLAYYLVMVNQLYSISVIAAFVGDALVFLCSLIFCFRSWNPTYFRLFPIYCFITMLSDGLFLFLPDGPHRNAISATVYNVFDVIDLLYLSYFLKGLIHSARIKKWTNVLVVLLLIYTGSVFWRLGIAQGAFTFGAFLTSLILLILCFTYYKEVLVLPDRSPDLRKDPAFWVVTSFTFEFMLFIPTILFTVYFIAAKQQETANLVYSVNNYGGIVSDILIIIAFTCRIKR
jgi:hypothetical protein